MNISYKEYYKKAINNYKKENLHSIDISNNIYDFTIDHSLDFDISKNILSSFKKKILYEFEKNNKIKIAHLLAVRNIYIFDKEIEYICQKVIPYIEKNIYGCYLNLTRCYIYKNIKTNESPVVSWLWHWDHHIDESIKVLIYLTDTSENDGTFEYLKHKYTGKGYRMCGYKTSLSRGEIEKKRKIFKKYRNSRITNEQIKEFGDEYIPHKITGNTGKTIIFNQNIIHKANIPTENERIAVILQLRPIINKRDKYFSKKYTKTFVNQTPQPPKNPYDI